MFTTPADALAANPPSRARRAAVAVPDGTRPVDVGAALAALRPYCDDAVAIVGLGLHRRMRDDELFPSPFPVVQHDPDDTITTGAFDGIPGGVSRHVEGCDALWTVGIVEMHQYAGFSGGHKGVTVGIGARATIDALHHRDRVTAPGVLVGQVEGNPFRGAIDALGAMAGCGYALNTAAGRWLAGEPVHTFRAAAASLDCWWDLPRAYDAMVFRVPPRKAVNFYQASRAATYVGLSARPPLLPGATLYLEAACPEGLGEGSGERAFAELAGRVPYPWTTVLTGEAPAGGGTQRAIMLALLLQKYRLVVTGCAAPEKLRAVGIEAHRERIEPPGALVVDDPFGKVPRLLG